MARTCPEGHLSRAEDYCDVCGLSLADAASVDSPDADATSPDLAPVRPASMECPNCSAENAPDALFCEACGYDYTTGTMPRRRSRPSPADVDALGGPRLRQHLHGEDSGDGGRGR